MVAIDRPTIQEILKSRFGYDSFLPLQEEVITNVLAGNDGLVLMPTGGGKSLCYQLPALCFDGLTLVVSPLIALMKDQVDALEATGVPAGFVNSTLTSAERSRVQARLRTGELKALYVAPERLAMSGFHEYLKRLDLSLIAIDEAHCISEWGHDFRPDYRNLRLLRDDFPGVPVIALTATATPQTRVDIIDQLDLGRGKVFVASFNRPNLTYISEPKRRAFEKLVGHLQRPEDVPAIVYCFSRNDTEQVAADLSSAGLRSLPYHAGLDSLVRSATQEKFIRDEVPIVVATIAFGMGIDKPDIRTVVHYDLPKSVEGYYQETGRAGRDGLPSNCILFFSQADKIRQEYFIDEIEDPAQQETARLKLSQMIELGEARGCRRRFILEYFGEEWEQDNCGSCDVCLAGTDQVDATEIAQKVLSAVIRTGERFGAAHVIGVLRGSRAKRIRDSRHDQLSVYGIASDFTDDQLREIVGHLLDLGLLARSGIEYPTISVTQAGREFLERRERLMLDMRRRKPSAASASGAEDLEYDPALYQRLRRLRNGLAEAREIPAYAVFGNAALQQMAYYLPQSRESFSRISGVGTEKLAQFGDQFIRLIQGYAEESAQTERPNLGIRRDRSRAVKRRGSTYDETRELVSRRLSVGEIAARRGISEKTVLGHLERLVEAGEELDVAYLMPSDASVAKIQAAFRDSEDERLTPVRERLGEEFSYDEIRLVRLGLRQAARSK